MLPLQSHQSAEAVCGISEVVELDDVSLCRWKGCMVRIGVRSVVTFLPHSIQVRRDV